MDWRGYPEQGGKILFSELLALGALFFVLALPTRAATDVEIYDVNVTTDYDSGNKARIKVEWYSDVQTAGKVEYGTVKGVYTAQKTTNPALGHIVFIYDLPQGTTHYLRITATAPDGGSASVEKSIITKAPSAVPEFSFKETHLAVAGPTDLFIEYTPSRSQSVAAIYGTSADALTSFTTCADNSYYCRITGLRPKTTYYVQLYGWGTSGGVSQKVYSEVVTATTDGIPVISSIKPTSGKYKTKLTINGTNLRSPGNTKTPTTLRIAIGCKLITATKNPCYATGKVLVWNGEKIVYRIGKKTTTGTVYVGRYYRNSAVYTAKGPTFTLKK